MIQLKKFENQQQSLSGASPLEFTALSERSLLNLSTNKLTGPMSKAIRTHRTLNSSSKGIYQSWSSRFSSLYPVSLHPLLGTTFARWRSPSSKAFATFARWRSPSAKAFGSKWGSGRTAKCTTKAKRVDPRGSERSLPDEGLSCSKPPEEEWRGGAHSVGERACRRGRRRGISNGLVVWSSEDPQSQRDAKWSGPTIRILYGMYNYNSNKLCRVL